VWSVDLLESIQLEGTIEALNEDLALRWKVESELMEVNSNRTEELRVCREAESALKEELRVCREVESALREELRACREAESTLTEQLRTAPEQLLEQVSG